MGRKQLTQQAINAFRDEACTAALTLYATHSEVTLRQLARAMGCSSATPYRYFANKEELFMAVRARCFSRFGAHLHAELTALDDPLARLRALCHVYARYAHDNPTQFHLMFSLGQPHYDDYPWAQQAAQKSWSIVEDCARATIESGQIIGDAHTIAHMFWSATHGVVMLSLSRRLLMGLDYEALLPSLIHALISSHQPHQGDPS